MAYNNTGLQLGPIDARALRRMKVGSIDLDSVPRVKEHFARVRGRANSTNYITDHTLRSMFQTWIDDLEGGMSGLTPEAKLNSIRARGFTSWEDYEQTKSVITDIEQWQRSSPSLETLYQALASYGVSRRDEVDSSSYVKAFADLKHEFSRESSLTAAPLDGHLPVQKAKSSGFPLMVSKEDDLERGLKAAQRLVSTNRRSDPCVAVFRVQQKSGGAKTRLAFAYPIEMTLLEGMFAPAVIQYVKRSVPWITYATGYSDIARMSQSARQSEYVVETDFSAFDATISSRMIEDCFSILKEMFILTGEQEHAWVRVVEYFTKTPILMPDGNVYMTERGVPSGSWFTNIIDSMVNFLSIRYSYYRGGFTGDWKVAVLGDDALIGSAYPLDLERLSVYAAELGLDVSPAKSRQIRLNSRSPEDYSTDGVYYLGHYWTQSGTWYRELHVTVGRLIHHERYVHTMPSQLLRWSRLFAHAIDNPLARIMLLQVTSGQVNVYPGADDTRHRELFHELIRMEGVSFDQLIPAATGYFEFLESINVIEGLEPTLTSWDRASCWGILHPPAGLVRF